MLRAFAALVLLAVPLAAGDLEQAVKALDEEDWATATPLLETIVAEEPENVEVQFNLAYCYTQLQQSDKAVEHYRKVVELKPELVEAHMNLGILLMERREFGQAAPHFQAVVDGRPDQFAPALYLAHASLEIGDPEAAADAYQKAVGLDPQSADAHLGLGQSLLRSGRAAEAAPHYDRAAELDPELQSMKLELAEHLEDNGDAKKALALYRGYLTVDPEAVAVRERIGLLLLDLKQYPEAVRFFEQAVELDPTVANRAALAEAYLNTDEIAKALPHLREAAAAKNADPALRLRYANLLLHNEQFSDAARNYLALLERKPDLVDAWNGLAFAMYKNEDLPGALKALTQSANAGPSKPARIYLRAIIEDKLKLRKEALASYRRFLETNSGLEEEEWKARERAKVIERSLNRRR